MPLLDLSAPPHAATTETLPPPQRQPILQATVAASSLCQQRLRLPRVAAAARNMHVPQPTDGFHPQRTWDRKDLGDRRGAPSLPRGSPRGDASWTLAQFSLHMSTHGVDADCVVASRRRHPLAGKTPRLGVAPLRAPPTRCAELVVGPHPPLGLTAAHTCSGRPPVAVAATARRRGGGHGGGAVPPTAGAGVARARWGRAAGRPPPWGRGTDADDHGGCVVAHFLGGRCARGGEGGGCRESATAS